MRRAILGLLSSGLLTVAAACGGELPRRAPHEPAPSASVPSGRGPAPSPAPSEAKPALGKFGFYPVLDEPASAAAQVDVTALTDEALLSFLEPVARRSEAVLFGETHWAADVTRLAGKVFAGLRRYADFGTLSVELPYSCGVFLDHYTTLASDEEAERFADENGQCFLLDAMDELLAGVRRANLSAATAKKRAHVSAHDLEWTWPRLFQTVLEPYFGPFVAPPTGEPSFERVAVLRAALPRARAAGRVGKYPFVDASWVERVLTNVEDTDKASNLGDATANYYRQRAIVRNLTDPRWSDALQRGKLMLYGGANHVRKPRLTDGAAFLVDGSYLQYETPRTKGKVYSLSVRSFGYRLENAVLPTSKVGVGNDLFSVLTRLHRAHDAGAIERSTVVAPFGALSPLQRELARAARSARAPVLVTSVTPVTTSPDERRATAAEWEDESRGYDAFIVLESSAIAGPRRRTVRSE